ncbi:protein shisa-5-like [Haliotis rufescens]|uniref:protein shisa-5-like n=1 Tax=Haliotis rufescens TaxID=6454 RepID=UPI00201F4D5F|nr:protein shisa-5-like [Haliotis rufescens]
MYFLKRGWILLTLTAVSYAFEVCTEYRNLRTRTLTCDDSCCGSFSSRYCCTTSISTRTRHAVSNVIIGVSVGCSLILIAIIAGVVLCCVCCCRSSQGHRGRVVTTNQQLAVVSTGTNPTRAAYNAGYIYPSQPAPGTYYPQPAGMAQPPPPYSPGPGPVYDPTPGQAVYPAPGGAVPPFTHPDAAQHFENNPEPTKAITANV